MLCVITAVCEYAIYIVIVISDVIGYSCMCPIYCLQFPSINSDGIFLYIVIIS